MNFFTQVLHLVGSGASAFILARSLRDPQTRPNTLAGFQLAESGAVPFLTVLSERAAAEGDAWLAEKLARHAADERRHGQIFAQALKQLNKQVIDFKSQPKPEADGKPAERKQSPFFGAFFEGYSQADLSPEQMDWTVFMASTYILELDASKDFARMAKALPEDESSSNLRKALLSVAKDETGHANYLYEAMERRLSPTKVAEVVDEWRTRKVNALLAMVGNMIQKNGQTQTLVQDGAPTDTASQDSESAVAELAAA